MCLCVGGDAEVYLCGRGECDWGEHERAPHRRPKHVKICMSVCLSVSLTRILLTPIATLYDNGFSGREQNSSRAFNYPRGA